MADSRKSPATRLILGGVLIVGGWDETGGGQGAPLASAPRGEWRRHPLMAPARLAARVVRKLKAWKRITLLFPLRPMGWAVALDQVVEPADIWHGMWAGSLPALVRQSKRLGGRTIYDSRDVYMLSRDFARLEWPFRPILAGAERRWARRVDRVLTVNEPYADLIAKQLGVERPPVVRNCPARWTPPVPAPDRIRAATGIGPDTSIALYQGQLTTERGIEQAMDAVLQVPNVVLALLGFGNMESQYRERASQAPYAGKVLLLPAVPPGELLEWSASADVMLIPIQPTTTNHQFTTPQKLWEAMAAGVPVVAADLPGMAAVVEPEQLGVLCDPTSPGSIAEGLRRILQRGAEGRAARGILGGHRLRVHRRGREVGEQPAGTRDLAGDADPDLATRSGDRDGAARRCDARPPVDRLGLVVAAGQGPGGLPGGVDGAYLRGTDSQQPHQPERDRHQQRQHQGELGRHRTALAPVLPVRGHPMPSRPSTWSNRVLSRRSPKPPVSSW